ncbi:HAMP domain-containing histidine kinase [Metallumcola ferriviriculae]|uniref:histidine kinase n=1 Tax=Metallumcola ferriviriculae TaxID=3039180 RepID=A0AAU0UMM7_9FIRM|nr:HAMP domain-containing histidine kinase [Desulfitibacteraceae bacterium MK1]
MFVKNDERKSLLQIWTIRYLLTLVIGIIVIGLISTSWLRYNATQKRLDIMKLIAEEIADRTVDAQGNVRVSPALSLLLERRQRFLRLERRLVVFIMDERGNVVFRDPRRVPIEFIEEISLDNEKDVEILRKKEGEKLYLVKQEITNDNVTSGWVFILLPEKDVTANKEQLQLLFIMLGSLAFLGLAVIHLLTRKLSKPIKDVADAAKKIVGGDYDLDFDKDIKEKEVYELTQSFEEMAERLQQLELMRAELLAGVTHELKTPVASISGLVQAVKDEVVDGQEAKEFMEMCIKEASRLEKMVEDLLEFNSFAVGAMKVSKEEQNINQLVNEIAHQWLVGQDADGLKLNTLLPEQRLDAATDALRVQQILYNLFNNAKEAAGKDGEINLVLAEKEGDIRIDVTDNGPGIPTEEQNLVFERFYRGKDKKQSARGLGLGLTFSKMLAQTLGGDLVLKESSDKGTTFTLILTS